MDTTCYSLAPRNYGREGLSARTTTSLTSDVHKALPPFVYSSARLIPLMQGKFAIVDAEDFERISKYKWHFVTSRGKSYARTHINLEGVNVSIGMHRLVMDGAVNCQNETDHIDGNGLDNRKAKLRSCTHLENAGNRKRQSNNTSGYKGVSWCKGMGKWKTQIQYNYKSMHIGYFNCLVKAAVAYDGAAMKYFGEFAKLNFPELKREIPSCCRGFLNN